MVSLGTMRVSACTPIVSVSAVASMRGCAAKARVGRTSSHRFGMPAAAAPSEIERHIFAHSRRAANSTNGSLRTRACSAADLLVDRAIEQRLDLVRDAELDAGDRHGRFADRHLRGEIGLEPPRRQQRRPRRHRDVAADIGALVERLFGQLLDILPEVATQKAADGAGEIAGLRRELPGGAERAGEGCRHREPFRLAATASGPRATVQPISAFLSSCDTGLSRLPSRFFGAAASNASRMAVSVMAAGVTIVELRVNGLSGGTSTSFGRRSPGELSMFIVQSAPEKKGTTTHKPKKISQGLPFNDAPPQTAPILFGGQFGRQRARPAYREGCFIDPLLLPFPGHLQRSAIRHFSHSGRRATQT